MGFIARIQVALGAVTDAAGNWTRQFRVDPGGGAAITASQFGTPGDDSAPLDSDVPILVPLKRSGSGAIVGYVDPKNTPSVGKGERKLYARQASGALIGWVWLHDDGSIETANDNGSVFLNADGTVTINGLVIDTDGNVTTPGTINADGAIETASTLKGAGVTDTLQNVTVGTHVHPSNGAPPTPGT